MKFMMGCYTHEVKAYCDKIFFERFMNYDCDKVIVDNSQGMAYTERLREITELDVVHVDVAKEPQRTRFLRNVTDSANAVREAFLNSNAKYLVIIESDVLPPLNLLDLFDEAMAMADKMPFGKWAAIGGLYYAGFHNFSGAGKIELEKAHHVLSGCTVYARDVIEKFPFRWSWDNIGAFPDAWICDDINKNTDRSLYNYKKIVCEHMTNREGRRGHENLYST